MLQAELLPELSPYLVATLPYLQRYDFAGHLEGLENLSSLEYDEFNLDRIVNIVVVWSSPSSLVCMYRIVLQYFVVA